MYQSYFCRSFAFIFHRKFIKVILKMPNAVKLKTLTEWKLDHVYGYDVVTRDGIDGTKSRRFFKMQHTCVFQNSVPESPAETLGFLHFNTLK